MMRRSSERFCWGSHGDGDLLGDHGWLVSALHSGYSRMSEERFGWCSHDGWDLLGDHGWLVSALHSGYSRMSEERFGWCSEDWGETRPFIGAEEGVSAHTPRALVMREERRESVERRESRQTAKVGQIMDGCEGLGPAQWILAYERGEVRLVLS
uniref:Uncharacterized protein n=1 Tax=Pristionchus pacificus TaxID=54126 RepID=A0A8R1YYD3_PRIPA